MSDYYGPDPVWSNENVDLPADFLTDAPRPMYWRVMVAPVKPKEVSKGGIVLATQNLEAQEILNFLGRVVALGPQAGTHERLGGNGKDPAPGFPMPGDYVAYGRHAGQKLIHHGVKLVLLNDDELLAVVPNPDTLQMSK